MFTHTFEEYIQIQKALSIETTGFDNMQTRAAVKNFQLRMNLPGTGIIDDLTYQKLLNIMPTIKDKEIKKEIIMDQHVDISATTDLSETRPNIIRPITLIEKYLSNDQYCRDPVTKYEYIFIHHTSGWDNPLNTVSDWQADTRGKIGVQYVIGGKSIKNDSTTDYDGKIVKCIPDNFWAYHLGSTTTDGINPYMHKNSIGIELCNFGYLTKNNSSFKTYTGADVDSSQVIDLKFKFRGYQYWHNYSNKQLESLNGLLKYLISKYNIDVNSGLKSFIHTSPITAFDYNPMAAAGKIKGILSHTNVRKDKTDVYPHPKLIQMLLDL